MEVHQVNSTLLSKGKMPSPIPDWIHYFNARAQHHHPASHRHWTIIHTYQPQPPPSPNLSVTQSASFYPIANKWGIEFLRRNIFHFLISSYLVIFCWLVPAGTGTQHGTVQHLLIILVTYGLGTKFFFIFEKMARHSMCKHNANPLAQELISLGP